MKKVTALRIEYTYADSPDSDARMNRFYDWLINKAIDNILNKQKDIDNNSTQKYTENNGTSGRISNPRRSSQDTKSKEDHHLQDVQSRKVTSSEVWQGVENKQYKIDHSVGGEI